MPESETEGRVRRLPLACYPFLLIGTEYFQFAIGIFGGIITSIVYQHDLHMDRIDANVATVIAVVTAAFVLGNVFSAHNSVELLKTREIALAKLVNVARANSDSVSYDLSFVFVDSHCQGKRFTVRRKVHDLEVGEYVSVLLNSKLGLGCLEPDLPGGITFENVHGDERIAIECWIRILFIPVLSLIPLLGLIGPILAFVEQVVFTLNFPLFWLPAMLQFIWYLSFRGYFSPGKPFRLNVESGYCPTA